MAKITAYRKDTGEKVRIPEHYVTHPTLGAPFTTTEPSTVPAEPDVTSGGEDPAGDSPPADTPPAAEITPTPTSTPPASGPVDASPAGVATTSGAAKPAARKEK